MNMQDITQGIRSEKAFDLTPEMIEAARIAAEPLGVAAALHEADQLLGFMVKLGEPAQVAQNYIIDGQQQAEQVVALGQKLGLTGSPPKVLEFASGFGRVTRHLKKLAPNIELVASDIHIDACRFIEEEIGIPAPPSAINPNELSVGDGYDFIFVISLFSHLPGHSFGGWLKALYERLAPGGQLMFTANGQSCRAFNPPFWDSLMDPEQPGYGYNTGTDQTDIDTKEYGTTVAMPRFVTKMLAEQVPDAVLVQFSGGAWWGVQDEWVIRKPQ